MMISAVLVNYNEAGKLEKCLQNVSGFADEIVVLDLGSSDNSKNLSEKYKAKFFSHRLVPYVEKVRNYAVSKAQGDWILVLDPDEVLAEVLKDKLKQIALDDSYDAVNIPRKNIFFGHWIAHTNWWPDKHIRFFKKGHCFWSENIHQYPKVVGRVLDLEAREDLAIEHFGYDSISQFLERQNRYSEVEAKNLFSLGIKFSWFNFFWMPTREFLVRFIRHAGFLDGFYGFFLTILMMIYKVTVIVKLWEFWKQKK